MIACYDDCFFKFQIDKKLMKAHGMVARVRKEVEIHSRLKHPSILEVFVSSYAGKLIQF